MPQGARLIPFFTRYLVLLAVLFFSCSASVNAVEPQKETDSKAAYSALADILSDTNSRDALIAELRDSAKTGKPLAEKSASTVPAETRDETFADQLDSNIQGYLTVAQSKLDRLITALKSPPHKTFNPQTFWPALTHFLFTVAVTFVLFLAIRFFATPFYKRIGSWGHKAREKRADWARRPTAIISAFVIDLLILLFCVTAGNIIATTFGTNSPVTMRQQALFLNAFALIEFFKAIMRLIFAPKFDYLRPFPFSDATAKYWNTRLAWLSGLIGYGLMVVVPIIQVQLGASSAVLVNFCIMLALTVYAIGLILVNRLRIQKEITALGNRSLAFFGVFLHALSHIWHILAIVYFLVLFLLSQFDPGSSLAFMMSATIKSLIVVGSGALISGLLTRWISRRITLPADIKLKYPMLERRVNSYIPSALQIMRFIVVVAILLFLLDAWHIFGLRAWLDSATGEKIIGGLVHILLIMFIAVLGWTLLASVIEHRLSLEMDNPKHPGARERTLLTLFRNVLSIVITTITVMIILSQIGINIAPLLAGAGALTLAVSFGAQTLVKDVINGIFIQFENGMNTGEYVTVFGITGTVERMTIRSIGLRDDYGVYHLVPYSSITTVANYAREFGVYRANYVISRDEDIEKANEVLKQAVAELRDNPRLKSLLIGEPAFNGVVKLDDVSFTLRTTIRTVALQQWTIQYALDKLVKEHFQRSGIKTPHQNVQISYAAPEQQALLPPQNDTNNVEK
ncbi:mechanosensitive channel protein [Hafnia alvei]|uniref:mechanosensitive channel protein n=1 Tax=Hafnia alvei TaxID=569 RepID=UPI0028BDDA54|nr:mechanosensitive channel protein [Hafnia alvei]WNN51094.1 mechanosensitive channel protein [Hafnia alvei]